MDRYHKYLTGIVIDNFKITAALVIDNGDESTIEIVNYWVGDDI